MMTLRKNVILRSARRAGLEGRIALFPTTANKSTSVGVGSYRRSAARPAARIAARPPEPAAAAAPESCKNLRRGIAVIVSSLWRDRRLLAGW